MVDWSSTIGVDAVIIKGGDLTNIYLYNEYKFDQGLAAPINASGQPAGLSHLYFCYDNELRAEKTAEATWYKKIEWNITKTAAPLEASANAGEGAIFGYEVAVTKEETPGPYFVEGEITVTNESAITAGFTVTDSVGGVAATMSCPQNSLVPGESVVCTYSAELDAATNGTNTATITSTTPGVGGAWASAPYSFGSPILTEDSEPESITVSDTNGMSATTAASYIWTYDVNRVCSTESGDYTNGIYTQRFPNTATIVETTENANAEVTLNCYAPLVSKDAVPSFMRTYDWTIAKSVDIDKYDLNAGEIGTSTYTVTLTKNAVDSGFAVAGTITVQNPNPVGAMMVALSDNIDGIPASLDCGGSLNVPAAGSATCGYSASLPDAATRTNTATATINDFEASGIALVDFTNVTPTLTEGSEPDVVNVSDTNGPFWTTATSGFWTYDVNRVCSTEAGDYTNGTYTQSFPNTATIVETTEDASAEVTLNCYAPLVSKDAVPSFTRTYNWTIDKSVDIKKHELNPGETGTSTYTVTLTKSAVDSGFAVAGTITVQNPNPVGAMTVALSDNIVGIPASLDCGGSLNVPAAGSATCGYSASLPDAATRKNEATATINGLEVSGIAWVDFTNVVPTVFGYPQIHVEDVADDGEVRQWGPISSSQSLPTDPEEYTAAETCASTVQDYWDNRTRHNEATIWYTDTEKGDSDFEDVTWSCILPPNATLTMTKSAVPAWDREWNWSIQKSADQELPLVLSIGQVYQYVNYDVTVTPTTEDLFKVSGQVNITNDDPTEPARIASLSDLMSPGDIGITLNCPVTFPFDLAGGGSLTCSYERTLTAGEASAAGLPPAEGSTVLNNLATAKTEDNFFGDQTFTAQMSATFTVPDSEADKCVDIIDTNLGDEEPLASQYCGDSGQEIFEYPLTIGPYLECGDFTVPNVASLKTDNGKTLTAEWTINVEVPCLGGCTLTPGYWKTHSQKGPAPYDDTWALLDATLQEGKIFFLSGQSYYQVLWTPPKGGNAYYILAHAYIAAELNFLNEADPSAVKAAFDAAKVLFNTYTPAQVAALKGQAGNALRAQFIQLAGILDVYNNGLTGPGHCSEDATSAPAGQ